MYIRTKYEIVKVETIADIQTKVIFKDNFVAQSENLDELCDEFVLYDNILKTYGVFDKKIITFKWLQNHLEIYKGMTIYGAIYTDKGLIYVAKMNSKGDLELI